MASLSELERSGGTEGDILPFLFSLVSVSEYSSVTRLCVFRKSCQGTVTIRGSFFLGTVLSLESVGRVLPGTECSFKSRFVSHFEGTDRIYSDDVLLSRTDFVGVYFP